MFSPSSLAQDLPEPPERARYAQLLNDGDGHLKVERFAEALAVFESLVSHVDEHASLERHLPLALARVAQSSVGVGSAAKAKGLAALDRLVNLAPQFKDDERVIGWRRALEALPDLEPEPQPGETMQIEIAELNIVIEMAWIPPGVFMMGNPAPEGRRRTNEGPQHLVRMSRGFWMMTTEVQQGQFEALMSYNPSHFQNGPSYPVERVTWFDAVEFANKLTESMARANPQIGLKPHYELSNVQRDSVGRITSADVRAIPGNRGYRLPTDAEWEYACRAGSTGPFHFGATISTNQANYDGNFIYGNGVKGEFRRQTTPAGFFGARGRNAWGLYDMHGNVREWCWDWHDEEFYQRGKWPTNAADERVDPVNNTQTSSYRVLRGGSWSCDTRDLRSACRSRFTPSFRYSSLGFRLALDSE